MSASRVKEDDLLKAIDEMDGLLAKSEDADEGSSDAKLPKNTKDANGAFSDQGDENELDTEKSVDDLENFVAKGDDDDEDEDEDDDSEEDDDYGDDDSDDDDDSARKSTISDLMKSSDAAEAMDVTPFLETLVDQISESDMAVRKSVSDLRSEQSSFNGKLAKAVLAQAKIISQMRDRLDGLAGRPVGERRSILSKSEMDSRFEEPAHAFTRDDALNGLVDLVQKGQISPRAVSMYEMSGTMDGNVRKALEDHLSKSV